MNIQNNFKNPSKYIFLRLRTFCIFFSFKKKKTFLIADRFWPSPPPLTDMSANIRVFLALPNSSHLNAKNAYNSILVIFNWLFIL